MLNICSWKDINFDNLEKYDRLILTYLIKQEGMPDILGNRIKVLKRLKDNDESQYYIEYEKLCDYSDKFRETYPIELVLNLIQSTITNMNNYIIDINNSKLSDEEKALLLFVLPL